MRQLHRTPDKQNCAKGEKEQFQGYLFVLALPVSGGDIEAGDAGRIASEREAAGSRRTGNRRAGEHQQGLRRKSLSQGLNSAINPDYSLSRLGQFGLGTRACSQSKEHKALLIYRFMEPANLFLLVHVQHKFLPARQRFYSRGPGWDQG